jgi:hypothetical protein
VIERGRFSDTGQKCGVHGPFRCDVRGVRRQAGGSSSARRLARLLEGVRVGDTRLGMPYVLTWAALAQSAKGELS